MLNIQTVQSEHKHLSLHLPDKNNNDVQGRGQDGGKKTTTVCWQTEPLFYVRHKVTWIHSGLISRSHFCIKVLIFNASLWFIKIISSFYSWSLSLNTFLFPPPFYLDSRHGTAKSFCISSVPLHCIYMQPDCVGLWKGQTFVKKKKDFFCEISLKFKSRDLTRHWRTHCKQSCHWSTTCCCFFCEIRSIWVIKQPESGTNNTNNTNISSPRFNNTVLGTRYQNTKTKFSLLFRQYIKKESQN